MKTLEETDEFCPVCNCCNLNWKICSYCEDGFSHHDCGEDSCCCLEPYNNIECDNCKGNGGWFICLDKDCGYNKTPIGYMGTSGTEMSDHDY